MIPPEPEPEPPVPPSKPVFTYDGSSSVSVNGFPGTIYTHIQDGDDAVYVTGTLEPNSKGADRTTWDFRNLLIYTDASSDVHHCFARAILGGYTVVLDVNSGIGLTTPLYNLVGDSFDVDPDNSIHLDSSTPLDYYDTIVSGNFDLELRL